MTDFPHGIPLPPVIELDARIQHLTNKSVEEENFGDHEIRISDKEK